VVPAFACAARPTVTEAVATLRASGARRIAVASWFLAPGLLPDQVARLAAAADPQALLAAPLGADDAVASLIADRYDLALHLPVSCPVGVELENGAERRLPRRP
jgi:sirohydrochlorin ferrochelatase